jgi:hypothetical protein
MWAMSGSIAGPGMPVFDFDGNAVGVISNQAASAGVGQGAPPTRPFILPLKSVQAQLKMAAERGAKAVEEAAEKKADEAEDEGEGEKPADEKPADEKPADEKPADDKPADDKPADEPKKTE